METDERRAAREAAAAPGRAGLLLGVAAVVLVLDQATKALAVARLEAGESLRALDGVVYWTLQRNPGSAFGLFRRLPVAFTVLAFAISIAILAGARRIRDRGNALAFGLVLGGAVGNLVDRLARAPGPFRGRVVDFIDLRVWPVFNLADSGIVVGAALLVIVSWRQDRRAKRAG